MPTSTMVDLGGQITDNLVSFKSVVIFLVGLFLAFIIIEFFVDVARNAKDKI